MKKVLDIIFNAREHLHVMHPTQRTVSRCKEFFHSPFCVSGSKVLAVALGVILLSVGMTVFSGAITQIPSDAGVLFTSVGVYFICLAAIHSQSPKDDDSSSVKLAGQNEDVTESESDSSASHEEALLQSEEIPKDLDQSEGSESSSGSSHSDKDSIEEERNYLQFARSLLAQGQLRDAFNNLNLASESPEKDALFMQIAQGYFEKGSLLHAHDSICRIKRISSDAESTHELFKIADALLEKAEYLAAFNVVQTIGYFGVENNARDTFLKKLVLFSKLGNQREVEFKAIIEIETIKVRDSLLQDLVNREYGNRSNLFFRAITNMSQANLEQENSFFNEAESYFKKGNFSDACDLLKYVLHKDVDQELAKYIEAFFKNRKQILVAAIIVKIYQSAVKWCEMCDKVGPCLETFKRWFIMQPLIDTLTAELSQGLKNRRVLQVLKNMEPKIRQEIDNQLYEIFKIPHFISKTP